tara:strand:- start:275 stop:520 length:246 start_codon:yes stop_codon:yes gene_type:complete
MSEPIIIGEEKTLEERLSAYNDERKTLDDKYGFILTAEPYIDLQGLTRARPTVTPIELIPKPEPEPEHVHEASAEKKNVTS